MNFLRAGWDRCAQSNSSFFTVWVCLVAYFPFDPMSLRPLSWLSQSGVADRVVPMEGFKTGHTAQSYLLLVTLEKLLLLSMSARGDKTASWQYSVWPYPHTQVIPGRHCLMQVGDGTSVHDSRSRGCKRKGWNPEVGQVLSILQHSDTSLSFNFHLYK